MAYLSKLDIQSHARLAERDEESVALGGTLRLRELTRAAWREANDYADTGEKNAEGVSIILVEKWHVARFAAGVIDPETKEPMFTRDEVLGWPNRDDLWAEIVRVAAAIDELSEATPEALKSGGAAADEG
jgi:hypothetical protein